MSGSPTLVELRNSGHIAFDRLWKQGLFGHKTDLGEARKVAYMWLGKAMRKPGAECHFARFTREECLRAIDLCRAKRREFLIQIVKRETR